MAAPGTVAGGPTRNIPGELSRPFEKPNIDSFAGTALEGTAGIRPVNDLPIPTSTRSFGGNQFGGGIGGFFNQLAMMSPEQYNRGINRYQQFSQQFGPSMGGGFGMFNQLAQMTPEQYNMGMNRFNQFSQQFGQRPMPRSQMPMRPSFDPRVMPPPQYLSRPFGGGFGGGFGGQRFQPPMMSYGRGFGGGFNPMPMTGFTLMPPLGQGGMSGGQLPLGTGSMPQTATAAPIETIETATYTSDVGYEPELPTMPQTASNVAYAGEPIPATSPVRAPQGSDGNLYNAQGNMIGAYRGAGTGQAGGIF
tara:strand:+ start:382 stop:1296 length:915 start_codon:yes stop_codon:yes gene_type:complete